MTERLRVVTFNVYPPAYRLVAQWAHDHGHEVVLLVTLPSSGGRRYGPESLDLRGTVPDDQDVLVTRKLRTTAAPVIAAVRPDLVISATFSRRIPAEITEIPRFGALNLHPTPLPRGRGPNPARTIYDGDDTIGVTLHRIEPEFDAGAMLVRLTEPLGANPTGPGIHRRWMALQRRALDIGVPRARAGEWGESQPDEDVTYAARFTPDEHWIDWREPAATIERKVAALGVYQPTSCAVLDGRRVLVLAARPVQTDRFYDAEPGTVLEHLDGHHEGELRDHRPGTMVLVRAGDGPIAVSYRPLGG